MTTNTPRAQLIREILADGEWHDRGDVIISLAGLVPPVAALKTMEAIRTRFSEQPRQVPREREELVRRGAYKIGARALQIEIWKHPNDYEWDKERNLVRRVSTTVQHPQRRSLSG